MIFNYNMENNFKANTVLDLLFHAANTNPSKVYCKSADHHFTYKHFIAACIKLSKKISKFSKQLETSNFLQVSFQTSGGVPGEDFGM